MFATLKEASTSFDDASVESSHQYHLFEHRWFYRLLPAYCLYMVEAVTDFVSTVTLSERFFLLNGFHTKKATMATTLGKSETHEPILVGMFSNREDSEKAYNELRALGYGTDDINVVMTNAGRDRHFGSEQKDHSSEMGNKALEGTGTGAAIGGVAGGIAGAIAALGTNLVVPGLGMVILGPLAAGLAGAGAGGLTGGIIGALVGAGIPKEKAELYHQGLQDGDIILTVHPHTLEDANRIQKRWHEFHGRDIVYQ